MRSKKLFLLLFSFFIISCGDSPNSSGSGIDPSALTKEWINSFEEQGVNDPVKVFRTAGYKEYPPSWYREKLVFDTDGRCTYLVLASNDAHYYEAGRWEYVGLGVTLVKITTPSGTVYNKLRILELNADILRYEPVD